jgi:hypothetical protein
MEECLVPAHRNQHFQWLGTTTGMPKMRKVQLSRSRETVDRREKKYADQLIQLPPSAQATAPVLDFTRSKFAGPRSFERQESRMGFERRRNSELCASFSRLSNEDAP